MQNGVKYKHSGKPEVQNMELQNAYKVIERLQKSVKDV